MCFINIGLIIFGNSTRTRLRGRSRAAFERSYSPQRTLDRQQGLSSTVAGRDHAQRGDDPQEWIDTRLDEMFRIRSHCPRAETALGVVDLGVGFDEGCSSAI